MITYASCWFFFGWGGAWYIFETTIFLVSILLISFSLKISTSFWYCNSGLQNWSDENKYKFNYFICDQSGQLVTVHMDIKAGAWCILVRFTVNTLDVDVHLALRWPKTISLLEILYFCHCSYFPSYLPFNWDNSCSNCVKCYIYIS